MVFVVREEDASYCSVAKHKTSLHVFVLFINLYLDSLEDLLTVFKICPSNWLF